MEKPFRALGESSLNDPKVAIEFVDRVNRIRGIGILFLLSVEDGYVGNRGHGQYIISTHLQEYLRKKAIEFRLIPMPSKFRNTGEE